jgi:predicted DNA-binding ribbon-helix-helix protein
MSSLRTRNVTVDGHRTSVRLEPALWDAFDEICRRERKSARTICSDIGRRQREGGFTSALRVYILDYFRTLADMDQRRVA